MGLYKIISINYGPKCFAYQGQTALQLEGWRPQAPSHPCFSKILPCMWPTPLTADCSATLTLFITNFQTLTSVNAVSVRTPRRNPTCLLHLPRGNPTMSQSSFSVVNFSLRKKKQPPQNWKEPNVPRVHPQDHEEGSSTEAAWFQHSAGEDLQKVESKLANDKYFFSKETSGSPTYPL